MTENALTLLIIKQLRGDLTTDELLELNAALAAAPENQRLADDLRRTWQATERLPEAPSFSLDLNAEFARLEQLIAENHHSTEALVVRLSPWKKWSRFAAAAAILAAVFGLGRWYFSTQPVMQVVENQLVKREIKLADGSVVMVNSHSKLTFTQNFSGKTRLVRLDGEAYFEVAKDASKPFVVETDFAKIRVVGTHFNVNATTDRCEIFVEEGHVVVENNGQTADLTAGQGFFVFKNGAKFQPTVHPNATAWAHGSLRFENAPVAEVVRELEHFYDVKISVENQDLLAHRFSWTQTERGGDVEDALKILAATFGASVERISEKAFRLR